jgi:hypothetical protein
LNTREWEGWLEENYGQNPRVIGDSHLAYLKKTMASVNIDLQRMDFDNPDEVQDVVGEAVSLNRELWEAMMEADEAHTHRQIELAVLRMILGDFLAEKNTFPVPSTHCGQVARWCADTLTDYTFQGMGAAALVTIAQETEQVLFKLRWSDERHLE